MWPKDAGTSLGDWRRWSMRSSMLRALAGLWLAAVPVLAQDFRGSIAGTVTDSTGGVLPGAMVTVTHTGTGISQDFVADHEGRFRALYLASGTYSVSAKLDGFSVAMRKGIEVRVGDALVVDLTLATGALTETVEVTG